MKSYHVKRIGAIAAGAAMLGAALSGAVSATFDDTGLTKGFFYDTNYNPLVQIAVGEKGLASDAVSAGNIAATIGNLAYKSTSVAAAVPTAGGKVVLGVSAKGATGKYEQTNNRTLSNNFYDDDIGNIFYLMSQKYEKGSFISYSLACGVQSRTEAGILKEATYNNIICLFCQTLCNEALENPSHDMAEWITVDYSKMTWYEDGLQSDDTEKLKLKIDARSLQYGVDAGEIPISTRIGTSGSETDWEWRGKFLLFGEEYYVKQIKGLDKIYLAKGKILDDVTSKGFTAEYMGYKFKINHLIYAAEFNVAGILLDVEKPDGTVVQTQVSKMANGIVDDIEIAGVFAEEADAVATASLIVYDTTTNVVLEENKDLVLGGETKKYWRVSFGKCTHATDLGNCNLDTTEYDNVGGTILENVTVEYRHEAILEEGESLNFPSTYKFAFDGFKTSDYQASPYSGAGEGNIKIDKDSKYRLLISLTGDDGNRYNDVYLDQGPFARGDKFIINGLVFSYKDSEEQTDDITMRVTLSNLIQGGVTKVDLTARNVSYASTTAGGTADGKVRVKTKAWEKAGDNDKTIELVSDSLSTYSDLYYNSAASIGGISIPMIYYAGDVYFVQLVNGTRVGVDATQVGTITKFEGGTKHVLQISAIVENGTTDVNYEHASGTCATGIRTSTNANCDDVLIKVKAESTDLTTSYEYAIIDMYDRLYNDTAGDVYYEESVKIATSDVSNAAPLGSANEVSKARLDQDTDTLLILPGSGDRISVDYGGDYRVESVEILHPQDKVYATVFIGTSEEETLLESVITKADEGTSKSIGCCTYTVKEFSMTAGEATAVDQISVNVVPTNLVVPEISADTTKNLIVVGGPAVNGLTTVTAAELQAASQQYIVKKDGKKLIVAGYTAADTLEAGNALIKWLQDNAHK